MSKPRVSLSVWYAWQGLRYAVRTQRNMRIHLVIGTAAVVAASWLPVGDVKRVLVWLAVGLVLVAELLNTALEVLVDLLSKERGEPAKMIKDLAAGAVLVSCGIAVIVGVVVFLPFLLGWVWMRGIVR